MLLSIITAVHGRNGLACVIKQLETSQETCLEAAYCMDLTGI